MEALNAVLPPEEKGAMASIAEAVDGIEAEIREEIQNEVDASVSREFGVAKQMIDEVKTEAEEKLEEAEQTALAGYEEARKMLLEARDHIAELEEKHRVELEDAVKAAEAKAAEALREQREQALAGYAEAAEMLERQKDSFESQLDENTKIAAETIRKIASEKDLLAADLREAYEARVQDVRDDMVEKIDEFLTTHVGKIEEAVRAEVVASMPESGIVSKMKSLLEEFDVFADGVAAPQPREGHSAQRDAEAEKLRVENESLRRQIRLNEATMMRVSTESARAKQTLKALARDSQTADRREIVREAFDRAAGKNSSKPEGIGLIAESSEAEVSEKTKVPEKTKGSISVEQIIRESSEVTRISEKSPEKTMIENNLNLADFMQLAGITAEEN